MKTGLFALLLFSSAFANAIVIRHDVDDSQYLAALSDFPALATFYADGAHGTLISPQWVVTAAHATFCLTPGSSIKVNRQHATVKQKWIHPQYKPDKENDIALVQLTAPLTGIPTASLYRGSEEQDMSVWFIGAGGTGNGKTGQIIDNFENKGVLRKAQNRVIDVSPNLLFFLFDEGQNALPLEGVSGGGDSGGPAYIMKENTTMLVGISSRFRGEAIGLYGIREVYTRVSAQAKWIDSVINATEKNRPEIAKSRLHPLPAGLKHATLSEICRKISLTASTSEVLR